MTNFSKCLYDLIDNADIAAKEGRIQENMEKFSVGVDDAIALDNMLIATSRTVCRIVGHKIDGLPPHLQRHAIRMLPGSVAVNLMSAHDLLGAILRGIPLELLGMDSPSDDCDCVSCRVKRAMIAEVNQVRER